jgi:hypothetical protein
MPRDARKSLAPYRTPPNWFTSTPRPARRYLRIGLFVDFIVLGALGSAGYLIWVAW